MATVVAVMRDVLLCSDRFWEERGDDVLAIDPTIEVVRLIDGERLSPDDLERITIAFFTPDLFPNGMRAFLGTSLRCPNLQWFQGSFAGVDNAAFQTLIERGITFTTGSGATAPAIAEAVTRIPQVLEVHTVTGREDLLVRVATATQPELLTLIEQIVRFAGVIHSTTWLTLTNPLPHRTVPALAEALDGDHQVGSEARDGLPIGVGQWPTLVEAIGEATEYHVVSAHITGT